MTLDDASRDILKSATAEARRNGHMELRPPQILITLARTAGPVRDALIAAGVEATSLGDAEERERVLATTMRELEDVRRSMDAAIAGANYELAAQLRDREVELVVRLERLESGPHAGTEREA